MPGAVDDVRATLSALEQHIRDAAEKLASPDLAPVLHEMLHQPDALPDRELAASARRVVDAADALQLMLVPSVHLLADGFFGYLNSKAMAAVVQAEVPDALEAHGPLSVEQLGPLVGVQPPRLEQLMDTLVNNGIFTREGETGAFANNRCSQLLRRDHWTQWHLWADLYPNRFFDISRSIPLAIRLGETKNAAQIEYGTDLSIFDYLSSKGEIGQFHRTLGAGAVAMAGGTAVDYPWEDLGNENIVDLGAGSGDFLVSILRQHPSLRGSLVDLQHAIDLATPSFRQETGRFRDVESRVSLYVGDFFGNIPSSSVYTIKWCLHNWMDEDVVRILKNTRAKLIESPSSRFIILESLKRPGRSSRLPRYGDLVMMMTVNGKERSEQDWARLAHLSGWNVHRIFDIRNAWVSAIELRPA